MDASVEFLLENLKQLVVYHVQLIAGAKDEFEMLARDLELLKAFLADSVKYRRLESFKHLEQMIREVVYDVEDTIDTCITQMMAARKHNRINRLFKSSPLSLAKAVKAIRTDRMHPLIHQLLHNNFDKLTVLDTPDHDLAVEDETRRIRQKMTGNTVGFEDEIEHLTALIHGESDGLRVASIVGMGGLGKTTLARKIFEHEAIQFEFPVRIWVNISDVLNMKNVLLTILEKFECKSVSGQEYSEHESIAVVQKHLENGKFLIVIDDIWSVDAWRQIKIILPSDNKMGRVLVTTRMMDVAYYSSTTEPHHLRFFNLNESWELLQYEVFGKLNAVPPELEAIGKAIAMDCNGLPLAIILIGAILAKTISSRVGGSSWMRDEWIQVSERMKTYLVSGESHNIMSYIIRLSYEKLPYELKNCFLYFGVFPEDAHIPVRKLIWLWVAEGFIQQRKDMSLEEAAHENLKELINRNLVMVRKAKVDGNPKTCHIHGLVREMCQSEAQFGNLNLFQEIRKSNNGVFEPHQSIDKIRRLSIHSHVLEFFSTNPATQKARSFLCFHDSPMNLRPTEVVSFTKGFGLLRVYDAVSIKFPKIPIMLAQILHLRYLTLAVDQCMSLPEFISELWNLQTLILHISSRTLDMKADIWKMMQLRHLKTKASITLRKDGRGEGGENLQTLSRLSPESCTSEVFRRAKNLITLGVQGDLNKLDGSGCFEGLDRLNKLKLVHGGNYENPLRRLPGFPQNLKILVLTATYLDWRQMNLLSKIDSLEVLKLKENAFTGNIWEATDGAFQKLIGLHIEGADLRHWKADDDSFRQLRYLVLSDCVQLYEIPNALFNNIEIISMKRVTRDAVSSARANLKKQESLGRSIKLEIALAD